MLHIGRRQWRLFSFAAVLTVMCVSAKAQTPSLTTVSDTVYRADGSPAAGTLLISWPAFTTADGYTVAAGNKSAILGNNGG
jgi:trimeric autotransporter adhesin